MNKMMSLSVYIFLHHLSKKVTVINIKKTQMVDVLTDTQIEM